MTAAFAAVYLIWGSTYLAIRYTIETLPPLFTAGLRFFLAGIILYVMCMINKEPPPQKAHWKSAFIIGGFLLLGGNGNVVWAEHYIPSGVAALFVATTPLWMVLLQWLWQKGPRPSIGVFVGIAIGFLGVWFLIGPDLSHTSTHHLHLGGSLLILAAAFLWAIGSVYSRKAFLPSSPFLATAMQMIAGGMLLMMMGLCLGELSLMHPENFSTKSILAFVYLTLVGSLIGFTSYIWLLKNVGVAKTSTYAFVNPVVAVFLGWMFAGEQLNFHIGTAAVLVVAAVIVITLSQKDKSPVVQSRSK